MKFLEALAHLTDAEKEVATENTAPLVVSLAAARLALRRLTHPREGILTTPLTAGAGGNAPSLFRFVSLDQCLAIACPSCGAPPNAACIILSVFADEPYLVHSARGNACALYLDGRDALVYSPPPLSRRRFSASLLHSAFRFAFFSTSAKVIGFLPRVAMLRLPPSVRGPGRRGLRGSLLLGRGCGVQRMTTTIL